MLRLKVAGMTCQHCVAAVRHAVVTAAPQAEAVIDLAAGTADIAGPADAACVIAAIADEGYKASVA